MPPEMMPPATEQEREPSLLDDLLETSERLFHRAVAGKQLELQAKLEEAVVTSREWYRREIASPGARKDYLDFLLWQHLQKVRHRLKAELREFMDAAIVEQAGRDQEIIHRFGTPHVDGEPAR